MRTQIRCPLGSSASYALQPDETLLVPEDGAFDFEPMPDEAGDAACMAVKMNPRAKDRVANKG